MKTSGESFVAFFSYVRRNDKRDRGRLTDLRKALEYELWAQTAKNLRIFQDVEDIDWGDQWKKRITSALDNSDLLITIVTPGYLESRSCRFEFEYFLKQESQLKRKMILPILYIDTPGLQDSDDKIAVEISQRQWVDWTDLRFASLTSVRMNKRLEALAKQIRDLISDQASVINVSRKESEFPPNSILSKTTEVDTHPMESIQTQPGGILPSLYIPLAQEEKDKEHTPQQITIVLRSTNDKERDRRRIKAIYGTLISFHGRDRFSFQIFEAGKGHLIDFPDDTTRVCTQLLERLKKLMGEGSWRAEEITFR